jgi:hypothetical protein
MPDKEIQIKFSELADRINTSHAEVVRCSESRLHYAKVCGEAIITIYSQLIAGDQIRWLTKHCPDIPPATARTYIRVFQEWDTIKSDPKINTIAAAKKMITKPKIIEVPSERISTSKVESNNSINPKSEKRASSAFPMVTVVAENESKPQPASVPKPEVKVRSLEDELDSALEQIHDLQNQNKKLSSQLESLRDRNEDLESNLKKYNIIRKKLGPEFEDWYERLKSGAFLSED